MDLSGRKVLVIGLGKTGIAAARFLHGRGADVAVTDEKPVAGLQAALSPLEDIREGIDFRAYEPAAIRDRDLVIPSPGVPPFNFLLSEALRKGVEVMSELEVASRFLRKPLVAITGTNGKTTTTTLIGELLEGSGRKVFVGGNIGNPLIGYVDSGRDDDFIVVEVSSFQLEWASTLRPNVAVLLNTTPDHIDYHGSFESYRAAKERLFMNQEASDLAILNGDEPQGRALARRIRSESEFFSTKSGLSGEGPPRGIYLDGEALSYAGPGARREQYPLSMIKIPGAHNIENVMAAVLAARKCGCSPDEIIRAVSLFRGVSHRIEFAGEKRGVLFYDDSKGTNVGAVLSAIESFSRPIVLLMGGRDKEGDFETLEPLISRKVKSLILFGEAAGKIQSKIGGIVHTERSAGLGEAFGLARRNAAPGDVVLLSPGCASFDEFSDYAERGRFFKEMVNGISDE